MSRLIAAPHPFKTEVVDRIVPDGLTLADMLDIAQCDAVLAAHAHIWIGEHHIPRHLWHRVRPKAGVIITLRVVPHGGGGGGKNPLRTVLTLAVVAAAIAVSGGALGGPALLGAAFAKGTIGAAIGAGVISTAGMLLVNAIAPVRPPSLGALSGTSNQRDSPTLFIEGARNAARPFGTVPVVLGVHKHVPPLGAQSFTEIVGDDNYLRMLVVWGYGPLKIEDIKIGETSINEFEGVQIETREGRAGDAALTLMPDTVSEESFSILLQQVSDWQTRSAPVNTDELSVDVTLPQGLVEFNDKGGRGARSVVFQIQFREVGSVTWLTPTFTATTVPDAWVSGDTITLSHNRTSAVRHGLRWSVAARGDYEVRIRRTTADVDDTRVFDQLVWTALRGITDEDPIQFDQPLAVTALVIKATDQLNRAVDELNATVSSYVEGFVDATYDLTGGTLPAGVTYAQPTADFDGSYVDADGVIQYASGPDELRWEHRWDGAAWALAGLLNEPDRVNLQPHSKASTANWSLVGGGAGATSEDLTLNALGKFDGVRITSGGANWHSIQSPNMSLTSGVTYAFNGFYRPDSTSSRRITCRDNSTGNVSIIAGSMGAATIASVVAGSLNILSETLLEDGTYHLKFTWTPNFTGSARLRTGPGTGSVQSIIVLAQTCEEGSLPTSYIDTTTAAQERAASVTTITETPEGLPLPNGTYDITVARYGVADEVLTGVEVTGNARVVPTSTAPLRSVRMVGSGETISSNPADLYRHVLQGVANARALPDARVDIDRLQEWHAFCADEGFEFNMIRDFTASVWDTLADVAAAGRASPAHVDGKWSVVFDEEQTVPVQHFTPRNSWGFEAEKGFPVQPDAFRVRFSNRNEDWRQDERIVYADGFTAANAEKFDAMDAPGITDADHVWKFARFAIAQAKLRPERWTFNVDFEHIVARRGDLVLVTHDVLLVGLASGRIKSVATGGSPEAVTGITVDETLTMEAGKSYGVSIRTLDDVESSHQIVTSAGDQTTVTFSTPIALANAPAVGDLFGFGELGSETIEGLLLSIEPATELSARLICIPASPAVYDSDTGTIPAFDSKLTAQAGAPVADIVEIRTDESVLQLGAGNTLLPHAAIRVLEPQTRLDLVLDVQMRATDTGEPFYDVPLVSVQGGDRLVGNVEQGRSYDFRVRWRNPSLLPGAWTTRSAVRIIGQTNPPAGLINATISVFGGNALIRWDRPSELDVRFGGEVRFRHSPETDPDSAVWQSSTSIGTAAKGDALFATLPLKPGVYLARVFDKGGRPSDVVALATKQASVLTFASVDTVTESPDFTGAKDNVVADSGALKLSGVGLFDDIVDLDAVDDLDAEGGIELIGTYTFASGFDLGSVTRVRLTSTINATSINVLDRIDGREENIDDWENFDGTTQSAADARVHVRHTDGDPAGSPIAWGVWNDLDSAEFTARGFQFRARLTTSDPAFNISVDNLSVIAEEL